MGTLIGNPQLRSAFNQQLYPSGIDLNRSYLPNCRGVWQANPGASFYAGQAVMQNSTGQIVLADGTHQVLGVAKWSKVTQAQSQVVDFPISFGTAGAVVNINPNVVSGSYQVNSAVQGTGTVYSSSTDYTINTTNGTITQIASGSGGTIPLNTVVYVSYAWQPTSTNMQLEGYNFWQTLDYVTIQNNRVAVIQAPAEIYTTFFDASQQYTFTGTKSNIYVNSAGNFTTVVGSNALVGRCINVPSANDPYLGVEFFGMVVADS